MINAIFTLDYEIFGNGQGSLKELVYEPTKNLIELFNEFNCKFVNFVEVAELIKIKENKSDPYISNIENQIQEMYNNGYEIGLHIHPQWFNAKFKNNTWDLDFNEENLCNLRIEKIDKYIKTSINYLKQILGEKYQPVSFRAGGWMIQPTTNISPILSNNGIKIDTSVFKGGLSHYYGIDFRKSINNLYYWKFLNDVNKEDQMGKLMEIPIYTKMVFPWKMISKKRVSHLKLGSQNNNISKKLFKILDKIRIKYPMKLDFTKMTFIEFKSMLDLILSEDKNNPQILKPIILIGHSKNPNNFPEIKKMLIYIQNKNIKVSTFEEIIKEL